MKKTAIINARLILRDHLIPDGILLVEDGKIKAFESMRHMSVPEGYEIIDAEGKYLGPGLIDIHTHAGKNVEFKQDPLTAAQAHLKRGTTSVYPALYFSMDTEGYLKQLRETKDAMARPEGKNIAGVYMEGPYLNPKFGAHKELCPWKGPCDPAKYQPIIDEAKDIALVWALAPEKENIMEFIEDVRKAQKDPVFSVAHSEAGPEQIEDLIPYGLHIGTHHTDATGAPQIYPDPEIVSCGVDETVNNNDNIYAELIVDSRGIHVAPYMLRFVRKIKGEYHIILISDAGESDGPVPEGYDDPEDILFDNTGEISGTNITLNEACRNMMVHTGASIVDVFRYASLNPAQATHIKNKGELKAGYDADLILVDIDMNVSMVMIGGEVQKI